MIRLAEGACSRILRVMGWDHGYGVYYNNFGINRR